MLHHTIPAPASPRETERVQIRSQRRAHWAWFDHALIDAYAQHIGPIGVALYVALARYANHHTGQCWPSLVRLSQQLGLTRLTARRYLQRLADHGLIALQERPGHTFLVTLLEVPREPQTCLRGKQVEATPCLQDKQEDVHAVNTRGIPDKHEPEILNQHRRTSLGHVVPEQGAHGSAAPLGTAPLATPSTPRDMDLADTFAQLPAPVQEDLYTAATARLRAQGVQPAFCIRPVVLAELFRGLQPAQGPFETLNVAPELSPEHSMEVSPRAEAVQTLEVQRPTPAAPAPVHTHPPTLRDVTLADLRDVDRLLALHHQAIARGWLRGGEAEQLTVVATAVHALRVGQAPCRLFVALLKSQDWGVITQEDEDTARVWLRAYEADPRCPPAPEAQDSAPALPLSEDACVVLRAQQVLQHAGWQGDPFLAVKLQDPAWTRARWEQAQAELAQWRLQQAPARARGRLRRLGELWEGDARWAAGEDREEDRDAEADD